MKTVYLNGIMLDRCSVFVTMLARRFKVALPGWSNAGADPDLHLFNPLAMLAPPTAEQERDHARRVSTETAVLAGSLAADLQATAVGLAPEWQVPAEYVTSSLVPSVAGLLRREDDFRRFQAIHPVDLVISGSDYGVASRSVVLAAKKLGIPTLNIEHGFYFSRFNPELVRGKSVLSTVFTSDFANLDNALEVEGFGGSADQAASPGTRFLSLGTPVETVASLCTGRAAAMAALGLAEHRKCVLLLGSWIEARAVNNLIQGQLETIAAYEDLLGSLAASGLGADVQLLIKLHPVEAKPEVFPGVKAALESIAARLGLPTPRIYRDQLTEVLSAADVVVSLGFSSLMFDAFQLGKPAVVLMLPFLVPSPDPSWRTTMSAPLRHGVMTAVESGAEVWAEVQSCFSPARQAELAAARERLCQTYGIEFRSVEAKSEALIDWIETNC